MASRPAWMTDDLAEEWIEPDEVDVDFPEVAVPLSSEVAETGQTGYLVDIGEAADEDGDGGVGGRGSCNFGGGVASGTVDFGSEYVPPSSFVERKLSLAQDANPCVGTFVVRDDLPAANLPKTPGKSKGGIRDMFAPLQLERMFEPPSPPRTKTTSPTSSPHNTDHGQGSSQGTVQIQALAQPQLSQPQPHVQQQQQQQVQVQVQVVGTMTPHTPAPMPSVLRMTQQRMSSRPAVPSKLSQVVRASFSDDEDEENHDPREGEDGSGTPSPITYGQMDENRVASDHRFTFSVPRAASNRAVSKSFAAYIPQAQSTPTPIRPLQQLQQQQAQLNINDSRLRLFQFQYDTYTRDHLSALVDSFGVSSPSNCSSSKTNVSSILPTEDSATTAALAGAEAAEGLSPVTPIEDDNDGKESFSRLRAAKRLKLTPPSEPSEGNIEVQQTGKRQHSPRKDYVGESKAFMEQIKRARLTSTASMLTNTGPPARAISNASSVPSASGSSTADGSQGKQTSLAFRQKAQDLMAKIKGDRQLFVEKSERSFNSLSSEEDAHEIGNRSSAPSPEARPRPSSPVKKALELLPDSGPPSYAASLARPHRETGKNVEIDNIFKADGKLDTLQSRTKQSGRNERAPNIFVMPLSIPETQTQADRVRSPNPTFLAPPTPFANIRFPIQGRTDSTNEDLARLVSNGSTATTATTLTAGSTVTGLGVKQAGPPSMIRFGPGDLPPLPDRVNGMVFDHGLKRWIKERSNTMQTPARPTVQLFPGRTDGSNESEDPFRDIESLHEESSHRSIPPDIAEQAIQEVQERNGGQNSGSEDMNMVSDSDSEFDDEEDAQLSTFTFDNPAAGVVQVMTGETDSEEEADNHEENEAAAEAAQIDSDSDTQATSRASKNNPNLSKNIEDDLAKFANMSLAGATTPPPESPSPARRPKQQKRPSPRKPAVFGTPHPSAKRAPQAPRSVLKSASVTPMNRATHPRSVSFSDGRLDGKIANLDVSQEEIEEIASVAPSLRSKRIDMMLEDMEDLENSSLDEDSPSKDSQRALRRPQIEPLSAGAFGSSQSPPSKAVNKRTLTRSPTIRSSPRRTSVAGSTPARGNANATFLTECSFGVAHDRLVEVITDVQPYEPYWEALSSIDLSSQKLESVTRLKEFLPRLDSLVLSDNALAWLSGIPSSVRTLSVASNALTSLTSFGHLLNIENLDISYNEIDSLQQLGCLRHLRELRADGNHIKSLEGLSHLDGLLKASFQQNELREIDFRTFRWDRLELLNCSDNRIESVRGLGTLHALISLNLDNNSLSVLDRSSDASEASAPELTVLHRLRILRLSGNRLKQLDVARFPNLRMLYVDNNCLAEPKSIQRSPKKTRPRLLNMQRLTKLENFSARNQVCAGSRDSGVTLKSDEVRDVKRLYLSGNPSPLPLNSSSQACYNLVYLELAACRITVLPKNFSDIMPNVRALNLNYNFIETDEVARGLLGLKRLRKLTIVGNRMAGTKGLIKMLSAMGQNVEMLDFRMNPCTLGWYLPLLVNDTKALLQPSEVPKSRHHTILPSLPAQSTLQKPDGQAQGTSIPEEVQRNIGVLPSSVEGTDDTTSDALEQGLRRKESNGPSYWEALDAQFRRGLPDKAYAGRLAYRGLIMRACPEIKVLDGVRISEKERRKAEGFLKGVLKEAEMRTSGRANEQQ